MSGQFAPDIFLFIHLVAKNLIECSLQKNMRPATQASFHFIISDQRLGEGRGHNLFRRSVMRSSRSCFSVFNNVPLSNLPASSLRRRSILYGVMGRSLMFPKKQ